jgi:hypothetical protein
MTSHVMLNGYWMAMDEEDWGSKEIIAAAPKSAT